MFGRSKSKKQPVQTSIGDGVSSPDSENGEVIEVRRFHRGAVIDFLWYPSLPTAQQVPEVAVYGVRVHGFTCSVWGQSTRIHMQKRFPLPLPSLLPCQWGYEERGLKPLFNGKEFSVMR